MRVLKGIFRFLFGIFRAVVWTAGLLALAVFLFFYVAARPIPRTTLGQLLTALSPETDMLDAHSASFGLREGLVLHKVRLLPKGVVAPEWFTADELRLSGGFRPDRPPREWVDTVVAHRVNLAALPPRPPPRCRRRGMRKVYRRGARPLLRRLHRQLSGVGQGENSEAVRGAQ